MPVYNIGDLVRYRTPVVDDDWDAVGFILEMREGLWKPEVLVLWSDMPEPTWLFLNSVIPMEPMQPADSHGITR